MHSAYPCDHELIIKNISSLLSVSKKMQESSQDDLLRRFIDECQDWLIFAQKHSEPDELKSLLLEVVSRFSDEYNVRIEPAQLDNQRLELTQSVIDSLENFSIGVKCQHKSSGPLSR